MLSPAAYSLPLREIDIRWEGHRSMRYQLRIEDFPSGDIEVSVQDPANPSQRVTIPSRSRVRVHPQFELLVHPLNRPVNGPWFTDHLAAQRTPLSCRRRADQLHRPLLSQTHIGRRLKVTNGSVPGTDIQYDSSPLLNGLNSYPVFLLHTN